MDYTKDDFLNSSGPYEEVNKSADNPFQHERAITLMAEHAQQVGVRNFRKMYGQYCKALKQASGFKTVGNTTQFEGQPIELMTGDWEADDMGISCNNGFMEMNACVHPIMPIQRLVNIDTGVEKLKLAFRKGRQWRYIIADKRTLASANSIVNLADMGIAVTSESAKYLVKYLHDVENLNYDQIEEKSSVSRLGWIDDAGFSPYVDDLVFDGDGHFKPFFESVRQHGDRDAWFILAKTVRAGSVTSRLILAASFASVLVKPFSALPFFVHMWGGTEVGKTVGLMLAASVWANPEVGRYIHTFNSTAVGREKSAAFVNSMPLILDELQVSKSVGNSKHDGDIYMLSEGAGKTRATRTGGVERTTSWANCILTNGEDPITNINSGGGSVNRVIEIECIDKLFDDARTVADTVRKNYGWAGREFVEKLQEPGMMDKAKALYQAIYADLSSLDTTEKQSMAAAIVMTADVLINDWLFHDGRCIKIDEIASFLQSKDSVSVNQRAYDFICQWVVQNAHRLCGDSIEQEVWGKIDGDIAYIVRNKFNSAVIGEGYSPQALLSWMKQRGHIVLRKDGKGTTKNYKINGHHLDCVWLRLPNGESEDHQEPFQKLPFDVPF
jgi:Superfamily II helicase and inactivated derivatives